MIEANILLDSISPSNKRLTTWILTYPLIIHAEVMTHRVFSRNASSSRAIPTSKMLESVKKNPFIPVHWGKNQGGMQANEQLDNTEQKFCRRFETKTEEGFIVTKFGNMTGANGQQITGFK